MLLILSAHHSRKIAFLFCYLFFLSGLCGFVYGGNNTAQTNGRAYAMYYNNPIEKLIEPVYETGFSADPAKDDKLKKTNRKQPRKADKPDIGGPSQPEMSAFKPVGADNMVDPFTGDFSYNIPLLDVGGYPVNIFYNSGITNDQEASWVGLGWNINPGTIMRNMRGLPDDFDGSETITKTQYSKDDKTWGVNVGPRLEFFGGALDLSIDGGIFFNNQRGVGLEAGINPAISIGGQSGDAQTSSLTFGWKLSANSQSGGSSTFSISLDQKNKSTKTGLTGSIGVHSRQGLQDLRLEAQTKLISNANKTQGSYSSASGNFEMRPTIGTSISFAYPSFTPSMRSRISSENYDLDLGFGFSGQAAFTHLRLGGYYTRRWIRDDDIEIKQPAYGMLYLQKGQQDKNALLDFNRVNEGVYTPGTPAIAAPVYTYDIYSISGEGTGGSFRAYRGDLGYMQDSYVESKGTSGHMGFEVGAGTYGHGALNVRTVLTPSASGGWEKGNLAKQSMGFKESRKDTMSVYFRNPGEKSIPDLTYQNAIGGEDLVRLKMTNTGFGAPTVVPSFVRYTDMLQPKTDLQINPVQTSKKRDKRTQVISFLTGAEADRVGLNKTISYVRLNEADSSQVVFGCNNTNRKSFKRVNNFRKANHISEIDVLMQDGRRYIYDIPVYNLGQTEVTFNKTGSGSGTNANQPITSYEDGVDNVEKANKYGKDGFVEKQHIPPYAHSYLLTGLLSPNYVDVKGDGITEDDMGDAIKFNYSKSDQNLLWRTPSGTSTANLSEGLKTDRDDDKAHYIYGEREMWYLYSIESKNMVARFYVRNDRKDSRSVLGETGGLDQNFGAYRLSKISLFTKGELLKNPTKPKPVKSVHFEYDYSLCKKAPGSINEEGKLTLKSIYFTYNGNAKNKRNYYRFEYPDGEGNPDYSFTANDRWGNYKKDDPTPTTGNGNPGNLLNADFPYTPVDAAKADNYIKKWTLDKITLPSGAQIQVDYESDDYAYVQDRRANNMLSISGFGTSTTVAGTSNKLYDGASSYDVIYVTVPKAITATTPSTIRSQIQSWYLGNLTKSRQIYMKLAVHVPPDARGNGVEMIPVYAEVEDFGLITGTNNVVYLKIKRLASDFSPMAHYSLQFLKSNLPSKAYKGYDVSESGGLTAIVKALGGLFGSFKEIFRGGMKFMMAESKCRYTDLSKSFIRLTNPELKKMGGGLRVKKVVINDNWNKMTKSSPNATDGMLNATYGQEYFYTKKEMVNGVMTTISSGVASWEPGMGADENPHRQAMEYYNRTPRADFDYRVMETPLAETMYPSAGVGYGRVEIRSIHRDTVKNAPGISVQEFYTTREFPTTSVHTLLSEHNAEDRYESGALDKLLKADLKTAVALSQGFKVDLNDMNGKPRKQSAYSPDNLNDPISYTENFYSMVKTGDNSYKLNHNFPVISGAEGKIQNSVIGRDVEIMTDFREHKQQTITTNIDFNIDVLAAGPIPIPIPTTWKPVVRESNIYRSVSVLKIVNHYAVLDSVVAVDKGSMVSTKNLVYDAETGDPLLTRTNNEQNKPLYSFSYPAHWAYSGMGLAYKNIDVNYSGLTFRNGKLDPNADVDLSLFESGDEIMVESQQALGPIGTGPCEPWILPKNKANKIWAIYTGKSGSATPQWVFVDADGNPYSAANVKMRIIRSGKRNMFSAGLGSIVSLNNPVNPSNGQLEFVDATNILQVSGASYKDLWRVDNSLYKKDSIVTTTVNARIKRKDFSPTQKVTAYMYRKRDETPEFSSGSYPHLLLSKRHQKGTNIFNGNNASKRWIERSYLLYDYTTGGGLPTGANLYKAFLSLYSHSGYPGFSHGEVPHGTSNAQSQNIPAYIRSMKSSWFASNAATSWGNTYVVNDNNLSSTLSFLTPSSNGHENYTQPNNNWIEVSNLVRDNTSSVLGQQNQLGLAMNIPGDNGAPNQEIAKIHRCFWGIPGNPKTLGGNPALTYYYYVCGDVDISYQYNDDPYVNQLVTCYSYQTPMSFCLSKFTQRKSINPYVEGVWGNWRLDTTFVYYGDRKESSIVDNTPVDLRTGGTIVNFKKFWNFSTTVSQPLARNFAASDVWVWNSTITQYNRKGYEVENKDPLGRFNAGLYGYNQQLPVAVVNNSRYMESMFDGFEDYDYQSNSCTEICPPRRHVDMAGVQPYLNAEQKHSGKQSVKLTAGQTFTFSAPVMALTGLDKPHSVRVKMDSTQYTDTVVNSLGSGFTGKYYNYYCGSGWQYPNLNNLSGPATRSGEVINMQCNSPNKSCTGGTNYSCSHGRPPTTINNNFFAVRWEGYIQPTTSGLYYFRTLADDGISVTVNGVNVIHRWEEGFAQRDGAPVQLYKGQAYYIKVDYFEAKQNATAILLWKTPNMTGFDVVPTNVIYPTASLANANTTITTSWCTRLDSVNVRGNALTDTFSLIQDKKMLVSAWVKVGGNDCKCSTYTNNKIRITYTGSSTITDFTPAGTIIEGWQRYEGTFTVPASATKINVSLMNTGGTESAWYDDIRIHPFNANMKSFVYHPQHLRLMAELDENNYSSFYEYDDDGTLTRVKKETIRGVKTITETRSHLQKAAQ